MASTITLTVTGTSHVVASDSETPLLYVLRNELGLVGTRLGCGMGRSLARRILMNELDIVAAANALVAEK